MKKIYLKTKLSILNWKVKSLAEETGTSIPSLKHKLFQQLEFKY